MSNDIGKPGDDIKKYDSSFLSQPLKSNNDIPESDTTINPIDGASAIDRFGYGYDEDTQKQVNDYIQRQKLGSTEEKEGNVVDYQMGGGEMLGRSLIAGLGDVFEGFGDGVDWFNESPDTRLLTEKQISKEIYGIDVHTPIADQLHSWGSELQKFGESVPGLKDVQDVTWSDMFDGDFWLTHWARALPFSLTFLIPGTQGARAAGALYKGARALGAARGLSIGQKLAKTGLITATKGSKFSKSMAQFWGGAAAGNMSEGAIIAGQTLNDAIEQGVPKELASVAAHDVFMDNLSWMAVDGLQLAMFSGTAKALNPFTKNMRKMKAPGMKRLMQQSAKVAGYALTDGVFEQFQEVFQDWSTRRRIAEAKGKPFMSYLDYFNSQEALPTRVIAFTSSLAVTGAKTSIDVAAERKYLFNEQIARDGLVQERLEILEQDVEDYNMEDERGTPENRTVMASASDELAAMKDNQLKAYMIRSVNKGQSDRFVEYVESLSQEGNGINEQQKKLYLETIKQYEEVKKLAPDALMNDEEQGVLLSSLLSKQKNEKTYNEKKEYWENEKAKLEDLPLSVAQKKKNIAGIDNELTNLENAYKQIVSRSDDNIKNIFAENSSRLQEERLTKEVDPKLTQIIQKQKANSPLTQEENTLVENNQKRFDNLKAEERLTSAKEKVGADFKQIENTDKESKDLVFQKKTKVVDGFQEYQIKKVDEAGNVTTTDVKADKILQEVKRKNDEKLLKEEADFQEQQELERVKQEEIEKGEREQTDFEWNMEDNFSNDKIEPQRKAENNIAKSKAKQFFGRRYVGKDSKTGKDVYQSVLTDGQRYVWSQNFMEENPDIGIYFDNNLTDPHGRGAQGAALGLSIFINPDEATQEVFVHEKWHVYQELFAGSPEIKALLKEIVKQPIFKKVKAKNHSKLKYIRNGKVQTLSKIIFNERDIKNYMQWAKSEGIQNTYKQSSYEEYVRYANSILSNRGYSILADSKQDLIANEALATAGGFHIANNVDYFLPGKKNEKYKKALGKAWTMIKDKISSKAAKKIIQNNFPTLYDKSFSTMLENAQKEFNKPDKERSYSSFKKSNETFYLSKYESDNARALIEQSMHAEDNLTIVNRNAKTIVDRMVNKLTAEPDSFEQADMLDEVMSSKGEVLQKILSDATYSVDELSADNVTKFYNKNAAEVDNMLKAAYVRTIKQEIQERFKQKDITSEQYEELETEAETSFGKIISEEFSRKINGRVTKVLEDFLDDYNKFSTIEDIKSKYNVYEALATALDGTKHDFELFKDKLDDIINFHLSKKPKEGVSDINTQEDLLASFAMFVKGDMINGEDAIRSMWHYFRSFTMERATSWKIGADGSVSLENTVPIAEKRKIQDFTEKSLNTLSDGKQNTKMLENIITLVKMKNATQAEKNSLILNFVDEFYEKFRSNQSALKVEDLSRIYLEGITLDRYFSNDRIDNLLQSIGKFDYTYYTEDNKLQYLGPTIRKVINSVKNISLNDARLLEKYLNEDWNEFKTLSDEQRNQRPVRLYSQGKLNYAYPIRGKEKSYDVVYKELYKNMYTAFYQLQNKASMSGMVLNPAGDSVDLFTKSAYIHNNLDYLQRMLPEMSNSMFGEMFSHNIIAQQIKFKNYIPEIVTNLGVYDGRVNKGRKNSQVKPEVFTTARVLHLVERVIAKADHYNHFVAQMGDSSRQYYVNNGILWKGAELNKQLSIVEEQVGRSLNVDNEVNRLIQKLRDTESYDFLSQNYSDTKITRALEAAVKINFVNKFLYSDLYYNRTYAQTYESNGKRVKTDLPKRVKGISSPLISAHGKRIEPIFITDPTPNGLQVADSSSYMLPGHAEMLNTQYGEFEDIGKNLKSLYYGQNLDNTSFAKQMGDFEGGKNIKSHHRLPIYLKSHTHLITPEFIKNAPKESRANIELLQKLIKKRSEDLRGTNTIPVIYFTSAIKGGLLQSQMDKASYTMEQVKDIVDSENTQLQRPGLNASFEFKMKQNRLYQFEKDGQVMYGFDGEFFGIQNKLDNNNRDSILSKQWIANYATLNTVKKFAGLNNMSGTAVAEELNSILGKVLIAQYQESMEGKPLETLYDEKSKEFYTYLDNLSIEEFGAHFIGNKQLFNNAIASTFKKKVMQIRMSGTLSTEMADIAFNYKIGSENLIEDEGLKSYRVENGKVEVAEIVIPANLAKIHDVKVGDFIFAARIPDSKIGDGIVYKVKHVLGSRAGNAVIIPSRHATLMGSDKDGDQLHLAVKNKGKNLKQSELYKNEFLDYIVNLYQQEEILPLIMQEVDFDSTITDKGLNHIRTILSDDAKALQEFDRELDDLSFLDEESIQERFIGNNVMLGIVASLNRAFNYFASGINATRNPNAKTKIYYSDNKQGEPLNMAFLNTVKDSNGNYVNKLERLGFIENVNTNNEQVWLSYAQFLNFIIDDGKYGNRARFRMQEESANHFAFMLRMGLSLETALDVMFDPTYVKYIELVGKNDYTKKEALIAASGSEVNYGVADVTDAYTIDLKEGFQENPDAFNSFIIALDRFGKDMRLFQQMSSLDSKTPTSYFEAVVLNKEFEAAMSRQKDMARMFKTNSYLSSQYDIFLDFTEKLKQEDIFSEEEVDFVYTQMSKTLDLSKSKNVQLLYNALHYNKMAVYMNPEKFISDGKGGLNFTDLMYQYGPAKKYQLDKIEQKHGNTIKAEEKKIKLINEKAYELYKRNRGNAFIKILDFKNDRKVIRRKGSVSESFYLNSVSVQKSYYDSISSEPILNKLRKAFLELDVELQNYFISYEFFNNKLGSGKNKSLLPFLPSSVRNEVKRTSNFVYDKRNENTIQNELLHANDLLGDKLNVDKTLSKKIEYDVLSDPAASTYRLLELINSYDTKGLQDAFHSYNVTLENSKGVLTSPRRNFTKESYENTSSIGMLSVDSEITTVEPFVRKASKSEIKKLGKESTSGKNVFAVDLAKYEDGNFKGYNSTFFYGDYSMNELGSILTYSGAIQENYQKLKNEGTFYLYSEDAGSFMFGQDSNFSEADFASTRGYTKWNYSLDDLKTKDPKGHAKFEADYAKYNQDKLIVQDVRSRINRDNKIQRADEELSQLKEEERKAVDQKYIKELPGVLTEYYNEIQRLHPLAIQNISRELQFQYGQALTHEQQVFWGKSEQAATLLNKVTDDEQHKDITIGQLFLSPGDFGQFHPTLASTRRQLERGNTLMHKDLKRATDELNEAYNMLYKDKFLLAGLTKLVSRIPIIKSLKSQESINDKLFENLLVRKSRVVVYKDKKTRKKIVKHETIHQLNNQVFTKKNDIKNSKTMGVELSEAELNYAKVISRYIKFYGELADFKGLIQKRELYAPVADASTLEVYRRRGIYGVYYKMFGRNADIKSVTVEGLNILNGKIEKKTFGEFEAMYSTTKEEAAQFIKENPEYADTIDLNKFSQINRIKTLSNLKTLANNYLTSGIDALGNEIKVENGSNEVATTENRTFNRYFSERSHRAAYLASGNLQYAVFNYVKTMVFQHGTEYQGAKGYNRLIYTKPTGDVESLKRLQSSVVTSSFSSKRMMEIEKQNKVDNPKYTLPNFQGFDQYKFLISSAQQFLSNEGGNRDNSIKYLQKVMLESFIEGRPKETLTGLEAERVIVSKLVNTTMRIGLGINTTAAMFNIAIGKYNAWKSQGTVNFTRAHMRSFGLAREGTMWSKKDSRKTKLLLEEFGILTYRPEEQLEGAKYDTYLDKILFYPMVRAERFIQEVQFIGELTDEQWKSYDLDESGNLIIVDKENVLTIDEVAKIQRRVQNMQGRGYSPLDQRYLQTFMLGSAVTQFKRWFPTFVTEKFGKAGYSDWMDDYGQIYSGTLSSFAKKNDKVNLAQYINPLQYMKFAFNPNLLSYKNNPTYVQSGLTRAQTEALQRLHRGSYGIIVVASLLAAADDNEFIEKLLKDMLLLTNFDKLGKMIVMPSFAVFSNLVQAVTYGIQGMLNVPGSTYKRDSKYGRAGDKKYRRFAAALTPNASIPGTEFSLKQTIWGAPPKRGEKRRIAQRKRRKRKENKK